MGGDERVLQCVGRILGIRCRAQGDGPQAIAVAQEQRGKGVGVTCHMGAEQGGVADRYASRGLVAG
ncbi:unannotated protein [freshwater metagenome]|uniref:Unannotated protein n=1 Tax=freshwater metagenome TaxID=449393 RepID=A0A6J7BZ70_9ZZZZ